MLRLFLRLNRRKVSRRVRCAAEQLKTLIGLGLKSHMWYHLRQCWGYLRYMMIETNIILRCVCVCIYVYVILHVAVVAYGTTILPIVEAPAV